MPCRLLLNISSIDPQTHLTGAFEALCVYPGDKIAISTPGKYSNHPCYKPIQNQPNYKQLKSNFMRRLLLLVCLTLALAVPAMAESAVLISCPFNQSGMNSSVSGYTSTWTFTSGTHTWSIENFNNNSKKWDYIKCGREKVASTASIATDFAIPEGVDKIEVTIDAVTVANVNSVYLQISDNANFSNPTKIDPDASIAVGTLTYTIQNPAPNKYYKLVFDCGTGKNGSIQISKVVYYGQTVAEKEPNGLTFGEDADATAYKGATEPNFGLPTLVNPYNLTVTYESSKPEVATIDSATGAVTIIAAGITTISATTAGDDTYADGSVSYNLEVIDATIPPVAGYIQITQENSNLLINGAKVIIGSIEDGGKAIGNTANDNNFPANSVSINEEGVITSPTPDNIAIFILGYDESKGYSFQISNSANTNDKDYYLYAGSTSKNYLKLKQTAEYADITVNQAGNATIKFKNQSTRNIIKYNNNNTSIFSCYSSGQNDVQIYVEQAGEAYEAPAAVDATFEGNSSLEGENLYIVAGENVTVTLPVPEGVLAYYYINDDTKMIRYTAPFEVSAGDLVGYYTEQYGLKSEEKMFEVKGIDFSGIAPELKGFNGEHAVMVSFDLTGFDGSVWYKFNDAATAAPALVTPAEEGYTEYAEPFKIAAVGTLTYKAESHGLMSAPVEKSITGEDLTTGVENVVVSDDSEAAYYDLNGRRVTNPAAGIYIRIAGGKATKAIIR